MSEHYPKSTLEVMAWCNPCERNTMHRVDDGQVGPCLEHEAEVKEKRKHASALTLELFPESN